MTSLFNPSQKIILALDGMSKEEVFLMVSQLPDLLWVKVGLELFLKAGPTLIPELVDKGLKVFLDLKFHDIPMTMASACNQAAKTGVNLITVHACAGTKALSAANKAALQGALGEGLEPPTLLAVTILTSWEESSFKKELAFRDSIRERVNLLAQLSAEAGLGGCVCSPLEVGELRNNFPYPFELVTPGIRLQNSQNYDQARVTSPSEAIKLGASKIVVGRPITKSIDPAAEFERICNDLFEKSI